jgi:purine-binding chemotaxis protein CheW
MNTNGHNEDLNKPSEAAGGQFTTFYVNNMLFGVEVVKVQEVFRAQATTRVPLAPAVVSGLINLRGQIVTAIDMRRRLNLPPRTDGSKPMNIVVRTADEPVSLLVDEIGDVLEVAAENFEQRPQNVDAAVCELIRGVFKLNDQLLLILDIESIARSDQRELGQNQAASL